MGRIVVLLVCVASCNAVYDLDPTTQRPPIADEDHDLVADELDNCPDDANASQHDEDNDSFGDACDNCPLIGNPDQNDRGDGDLVGDRCDPHPEVAGDCLVLFDSFDRDYTEAWDVLGGSVMQELDEGTVDVAPGSDGVALVARGLTGVHDVIAAVTTTLGPTTSGLYVASSIDGGPSGIVCGVAFGAGERLMIGTYPNVQAVTFGPTLGSIGLLRLTRQTATQASCRVELGVAQRVFTPIVTPELVTGGPGVLVTGKAATIRGVAIYAQRSGCDEVRR